MPAKARYIIRSHLLVVEGDTEHAFCLYVKRVLGRGHGVKVTIENARGGSPAAIIRFAKRLTSMSAYDRVTILFDGDKSITLPAQQIIGEIQATLIIATPCIEAAFLRMMGQRIPLETKKCKKTFHRTGLKEDDKCSSESYESLFPLKDFGKCEKKCLVFAAILRVFREIPDID